MVLKRRVPTVSRVACMAEVKLFVRLRRSSHSGRFLFEDVILLVSFEEADLIEEKILGFSPFVFCQHAEVPFFC
jgi:hypothetical protein